MSDVKRVLVVDDEPKLVRFLAASLKKLGKEYLIETAQDGDEALARLEQNKYDLILTDYLMPDMNGIDLARSVRLVSPGTQIVLMTAHNTKQLHEEVERLDMSGFINKPFSVKQIRELVRRSIEELRVKQQERATSTQEGSNPFDKIVYDEITQLCMDTGAYCVLLVSSDGTPIEAAGSTEGFDVFAVSSLVAANFIASAELANLLGDDTSIFKSSYHEGNDYNIYAYRISADLLLAVVFGPASKPGVIWFYTKKSAEALNKIADKHLVAQQALATDVGQTIDDEFTEALENALEMMI